MHVYRRPYDYAVRSAQVRWQTTPEWDIDLATAHFTITAPAWTIGLSPTINMDAGTFTITAPAWSVAVGRFVDMDATAITITAPAWSISYTQQTTTVPNVVGLSANDAAAAVRAATLTPIVTYSITGTVEAQKVTAQDPAAATVANLNTAVLVTAEAGLYAWPSGVGVSECEWQWHSRTRPRISPLTGKTRTVGDGGEFWSCTITTRNLKDGDRAEMQAFLSRLRGRLHRATLPADVFTKQGTLTAATVNGANQTGTSLVCNGCSPSTGTVKAGDMISLEKRLYMVVTDATAVASAITIEVVPPLEGPPASGAAVVFSPTGNFRLAENSAGWSNAPGGFSSFESIRFVEDRNQ
jgi:hypothetical protein